MNFDMTLLEWLEYHHEKIVFDKVSWMGVPIWKNVLDAWIYQELIYKVKPDVIVEIGSLMGGGTLYFANLLDIIGKGEVISVDINRTNYNVKHKRIIEITGDSASPEVIKSVTDLCKGKSVFINHDGDHSTNHVLMDLQNYSSLVTPGSYFVVEDSLADFTSGVMRPSIKDGPTMAILEFLETNHDFDIDKECERYLLTANPMGYLKRIA